MIVYHSPNALCANVEVLPKVVLPGTSSARVNLSLLTIAVVDGDHLSIRHGIRLWRRARCDAGHLIGTSAGCARASCVLWGKVVEVLSLRHVCGQFWSVATPPRVTLRTLEEPSSDFMVCAMREGDDLKDGRRAVEMYSRAHAKHAHLVMCMRPHMDAEAWHRSPMLSDDVNVAVTSENPTYDGAVNSGLALEDWLDLHVLETAFAEAVEELAAVTRVEVQADPVEVRCA
jgi:hypothetical protein